MVRTLERILSKMIYSYLYFGGHGHRLLPLTNLERNVSELTTDINKSLEYNQRTTEPK